MAVSPRIAERRRQFQQYKKDVQSRGKPFHPYAMLHDTIMSLVVVVVIVGLTILWKFTAAENHHGDASASGILASNRVAASATAFIDETGAANDGTPGVLHVNDGVIVLSSVSLGCAMARPYGKVAAASASGRPQPRSLLGAAALLPVRRRASRTSTPVS